jgi:serine/threonine protein kinase
VALKVIHSSLSGDQEIFRRFQAEAQVTSQLQHPAIVPVHGIGRTQEGELYYTMRKVQGKTLTRLVQVDLQHETEGETDDSTASDEALIETWTRFRVLQAFVLVCRAMAYAHSRGVVHRDLKPDNLMVGRFGQVYIMDWGVAKVLSRNSVRTTAHPKTIRIFPDMSKQVPLAPGGTKVGAVLGTPAFMAPEQAGGSETVGPQADVYSLGGILYFILTGQAPHLGSPTEVLQKVSMGLPPRRPGLVKEGVPRDLEAICVRAVAYDLEERLASADELADLIEGYLEGRPLHLVSRKRDSGFLRSYSSRRYRKPSLTVDIVPVIQVDEGWQVLLIKRTKEPFLGCWALPGSFIQLDETLNETARRVLDEKIGKHAKGALNQLGVWDEPGRDPRTRVVTVGYECRLEAPDKVALRGDRELAWFHVERGGVVTPVEDGVDESPKLAFDHARIVAAAVEQLEGRDPTP